MAEWLRKHESNSDDEFDIDFEEYAHFDDILVKSEILDDAAIVESVQCNIQTEDETKDDEDNEEEEKEGTIQKLSQTYTLGPFVIFFRRETLHTVF